MTVTKGLSGLFAFLGMAVLILDSECAMAAAASGITLCLKSVIPSLFPFLFLTAVLTDSLWGGSLPVLRPLSGLLGIPSGADSLLMVSLLGGYPAGAAAVAESCREGRLSREDACHLLSFVSNAGPAFLFGMTAPLFPDKKDVFSLWTILILSAFYTGALSSRDVRTPVEFSPKTLSIPQILTRTVKTMALICGWILLFRILSEFLSRWLLWRFPEEVQVLITGLLELSNGCMRLGMIQSQDLRFVICGCFLSFGGLCVLLQTDSVLGDLPLKPYAVGKGVQTGFSLVFSLLYLRFGFPALGAAALILFFLPEIRKKVVDFGGFCVYNRPIKPGRKGYAVSQKN